MSSITTSQGACVKQVLLSILFLAATLASAPGGAVDNEGKFYLVYLVSAVDLKPGSKVFVDPIFFTDGKEVKNFHGYCKAREQFLKSEEINDDLNLITNYCDKKTFRMSPRVYVTLNNHGEQIVLEDIEFKVSDVTGVNNEPVMMGYTTVRLFSHGSIKPTRLLRGDGAPEYFFLMARDQRVLKEIVPISNANSAEMQTLLERAKQLADASKGKTESGKYRLSIKQDFKTIGNVKLANPIFADIDADGKADLIVGVEARYQAAADKTDPNIRWLSVAYITGAGQSVLGYWPEFFSVGPYRKLLEFDDAYARFLSNGYPVMTPMLVVRLRECGYAIRFMEDRGMRVAHGIHLEHKAFEQSQKSSCTDIRLTKLLPPM